MSRELILDTNLLLLYIAGIADRRHIAALKRLSAYSKADFDRLAIIVSTFTSLVLTPHTITETSNLLRSGARTPTHSAVFNKVGLLLERFAETYVPSIQATSHPDSPALGITDAVLLIVAARGATLLTADLDLYQAARRAKLSATNFNHLPRY